jgi:hypothetical protein
MKKKSVFLLLALFFLIADLSYSLFQYYGEPMDGDMADIILPAPRCEEVLKDPFGWSVLTEQKRYTGPNRYFAHALMSVYFRNVPVLLQKMTTPLDAVYWSCAIFKLFTHLLFLGVLTAYCSSVLKNKNRYWILLLVLLVPLFQTYGYNRSIGLVLHSTTYTFFYSFPLALLLLFFWPFWKKWQDEAYRMSVLQWLSSFVLIIVLSFNGPLINPLVLIICPSVLLYLFIQHWNTKSATENGILKRIQKSIANIPNFFLIPFFFFILASLYSYYIGTFNAEEAAEGTLWERYKRIPFAIYYQFSRKIGFPLLLAVIIVNTLLLKNKKADPVANTLLRHLQWIGGFTLVFILLLPLGGYRSYRPDVLRTDTIMPITIALFYYFATSSAYLWVHFQKKVKQGYGLSIIAVLIIFTIADEPNFHNNQCERQALQLIAEAKSQVIYLEPDCTIMSWDIETGWKGHSKYKGLLLKEWNITEEARLWVQKRKAE